MWYDKRDLLSHNKILNMVLSNRGGGKTFGMTRWGIDDFKKRGFETVWVRRYQTEIDDMLQNGKFFDAVREYYPNDELTVDGNVGKVNGKVAFHFVALSTSRQLKSNNYPHVNKIIFDEFIIDKGRVTYLKNEVEVFLDLFETVARTRDNVRAVLLANAVTVVNPYFQYFNIKLEKKRFTVKGEVCVELFTDADFITLKQKTRFGRLVKDTRFGDYAVENKWLLDTDMFVEQKTPKAIFLFGLKYNGTMYGFWVDYKVGLIFVNRQYDPSSYALYAMQKDDHEMNLLLIKSITDSRYIQHMVFAFQNGLLRFEDMAVKNQFYELIGYFVR